MPAHSPTCGDRSPPRCQGAASWEMSVVLDSPSLAAAPSQPPSTPFVASNGRHDVVPLDFCERARRRGPMLDAVDAALRPRQSQRPTRSGHDSTLDDVLKLTNVARPRIVLPGGDHLVRDFLDALALTLVFERAPASPRSLSASRIVASPESLPSAARALHAGFTPERLTPRPWVRHPPRPRLFLSDEAFPQVALRVLKISAGSPVWLLSVAQAPYIRCER